MTGVERAGYGGYARTRKTPESRKGKRLPSVGNVKDQIAQNKVEDTKRRKIGKWLQIVGTATTTALPLIGGAAMLLGFASNPVGWAIIGSGGVGLLLAGAGLALTKLHRGKFKRDIGKPNLIGFGAGVAIAALPILIMGLLKAAESSGQGKKRGSSEKERSYRHHSHRHHHHYPYRHTHSHSIIFVSSPTFESRTIYTYQKSAPKRDPDKFEIDAPDIEYVPPIIETLNDLADGLEEVKGEIQASEPEFEAKKIKTKDKDKAFGQVMALTRKRRYKKAAGLMENLYDNFPKDKKIKEELAFLHQMANNHERAAELFIELFQDDAKHDNLEIMYALGKSLRKLGFDEDAKFVLGVCYRICREENNFLEDRKKQYFKRGQASGKLRVGHEDYFANIEKMYQDFDDLDAKHKKLKKEVRKAKRGKHFKKQEAKYLELYKIEEEKRNWEHIFNFKYDTKVKDAKPNSPREMVDQMIERRSTHLMLVSRIEAQFSKIK